MYGKEVRSKELLDGRVPPPDEAQPLYSALKDHVEGMVLDAANEGVSSFTTLYISLCDVIVLAFVSDSWRYMASLIRTLA